MGWKEVLKAFIGIFLFVSLLAFIFGFSFFQMTSYNTLESGFRDVVQQGTITQLQNLTVKDWNNTKTGLIENCTEKNETSLSIGGDDAKTFKDLEIPNDLIISCDNIEAITPEDIISLSSKQVFDSIYYRDYSCSLIDCFNEKQSFEGKALVFISKYANNFFAAASFILLIATLLFLVLIVLLSQPKYTAFYAFAPIFMIVGLPFIAFAILKAKVASIFGDLSSMAVPLINPLFVNFLFVFCLGVVFLVFAIIFAVKHKEARDNFEEEEEKDYKKISRERKKTIDEKDELEREKNYKKILKEKRIEEDEEDSKEKSKKKSDED